MVKEVQLPKNTRFNNLFDRLTQQAQPGLVSMACWCHDHKYDLLTQSDYYQLLHVFNQVSETGRPGRQSTRIRVAAQFLEVATADQKTSFHS